MKSLRKILSIIILTLVVFIGGKYSVNAVAETISLGSAKSVPEYISGLKFSDKRMTNGEHLYCLHRQANTTQNIKARLQGKTDNGLTYIMSKGKITGDATKDYYIKQTAVWWYLDDVNGSSNLSSAFKKKSGTMMNQIRNLVKEAKKATAPVKQASINVNSNNLKMTLQDGYYISDTITVNASSPFKVVLESGPRSYQIVDVNGNAKSTFAAKDSFKVKVPAASNIKNGTQTKIKISTSVTYYQGYKYYPTDSNMQKVARIVQESNATSKVVTLTVSSSSVKINKLDKATEKNIAGAKLVLRDWKNEVVTSWVSTTDAHIIQNLANGTYTVEETEAPDGYKLNTEKQKFTITDSVKDVTVNFYNEAAESVVNITKIDSETQAPLAGAVLVVKDSNGNEIERFTTTTSSHVIKDLKEGTYTVQEVEAPAGYMRNETGVSFTIDKDHLTHQITIENFKEVVVPNTSSAGTLILTILGIIITIVGVNYIKKNANA